MDAESRVRRYYELNTRRFLRFGQAAGASAIHRTIRHPDIGDPFRVQEHLLLKLMRRHQVDMAVDLGCGVGSSLRWLYDRYPGRYLGITLSPLQAELARTAVIGTGIDIITGSYLDPAVYGHIPDQADRILMYGIESWLHCADPVGLLELVAGATRPGDLFALWDDFPAGELQTEEPRLREDFRAGWHAYNLLDPSDVDGMARKAGFERVVDEDFTPFLDIDRPRNRAVAAVVPLLRPWKLQSAWWQNLRGGNALRRLLKSGLMSYRFRVWIRRTT